jgi:hypothetical protein
MGPVMAAERGLDDDGLPLANAHSPVKALARPQLSRRHKCLAIIKLESVRRSRRVRVGGRMADTTQREEYIEFVRRIRQGDEQVAEELVRRYEPEIRPTGGEKPEAASSPGISPKLKPPALTLTCPEPPFTCRSWRTRNRRTSPRVCDELASPCNWVNGNGPLRTMLAGTSPVSQTRVTPLS